jgi:hypothetical protein
VIQKIRCNLACPETEAQDENQTVNRCSKLDIRGGLVMNIQNLSVVIEMLALTILGLYVFWVEKRVRFLRRQEKRIEFAKEIPGLAEKSA